MSLLELINEVVKKDQCKCDGCNNHYDKRIRFVKLMESQEADYRKILDLHEYCSDECAKNG